eukprot:COSAG01_NODE_1720_length_9391_cov_27.761085_13_plen_31_part_01
MTASAFRADPPLSRWTPTFSFLFLGPFLLSL